MNITIASVVKDVEHFLPAALECWTEVADRVRIIDNVSTDSTIDILKDAHARTREQGSCQVDWATCPVPMDGNESRVRAELWRYASEDAEWVIHLDADHVLSADPRPYLPKSGIALFHVFDLWQPTRYRSDAWWSVRPWWAAANVKGCNDIEWKWSGRGWHSGHLPTNIGIVGLPTTIPIECSVLHYGYATPELREKHWHAYVERAEHLTNRELFHANTIIDEDPVTKPLPFTPRWTLL